MSPLPHQPRDFLLRSHQPGDGHEHRQPKSPRSSCRSSEEQLVTQKASKEVLNAVLVAFGDAVLAQMSWSLKPPETMQKRGSWELVIRRD